MIYRAIYVIELEGGYDPEIGRNHYYADVGQAAECESTLSLEEFARTLMEHRDMKVTSHIKARLTYVGGKIRERLKSVWFRYPIVEHRLEDKIFITHKGEAVAMLWEAYYEAESESEFMSGTKYHTILEDGREYFFISRKATAIDKDGVRRPCLMCFDRENSKNGAPRCESNYIIWGDWEPPTCEKEITILHNRADLESEYSHDWNILDTVEFLD